MPKSANQKIKILYLLKILLENTDEEHGLTLKEVESALRELGVKAERKTLYDDIETLRIFGVDIEKSVGKSVTYHVISRDFELPELKLLIDAVQSSKFISEKKSRELIDKLSSLMSRFDATKLRRQVYVANRVKSDNETIYYSVDEIHEAINQNKKISFQYFEWNEKKEKVLRHNGKKYIISPHALTWDDENYYMIGYDSSEEKIKHYRVDKMQKISLTDEKRDGDEFFRGFDMALYSKKTFGMFGGVEESVTLRCKNRFAGVVIDRFGEDVTFLKSDDEHFEVHVKVHVSPLFFGWVLNFGDGIEIVSPDSVRGEFRTLLEKTLEGYK
ncbi:MAG: WYL domain-containing protein [Clostridia bacterium]|nr:WYL domain-containing protein [Clostridia bacterium]